VQVPQEYNVLQDRTPFRKAAKLLIYLLEPLSVAEALPPSDENEREKGGSLHPTQRHVFAFLEALVNTVFPYTHPSNIGKWGSFVASLVSHLVAAYCRRVLRERQGVSVVKGCVGREVDPETGEVLRDLRLQRRDDEKMVDIFLPLLLQASAALSLSTLRG
jgi:hypothetical protein